MNRYYKIVFSIILPVILLLCPFIYAGSVAEGVMKIKDLHCEYAVNPMGIDKNGCHSASGSQTAELFSKLAHANIRLFLQETSVVSTQF